MLCNEWGARLEVREALRAGPMIPRAIAGHVENSNACFKLVLPKLRLVPSVSMPLARRAFALAFDEPHDAAATALTRAYSSQQRHFHDCGVAIAAVAHRLQTRRVAQQQAEHALRRRAITKK